MARHAKRSNEFEVERAKGAGPSWENALTLTEWKQINGWCEECDTYHMDGRGH